MKPIGIFFGKAAESLKENWLNSVAFTLCYALLVIVSVLVFGVVLFLLLGSSLSNPFAMSLWKIFFAIVLYVAFVAVLLALQWSYTTTFLANIRGGDLSVGELFSGFYDMKRIFFAYILVWLCSFVCSIVAGIVIGIFGAAMPGASQMTYLLNSLVGAGIGLYFCILFMQFPYILFDDGEIGAYGSLRRSCELMKGHKLQFFLVLLCVGFIFLVPCIISLSLVFFVSKPLGWLLTLAVMLFVSPYVTFVLAHFYESLSDKETEAVEETLAEA